MMKKHKLSFVLCTLTVLVVLTACKSSTAPTSSPEPSPSPSMTPQPTATATSQPTNTLSPTSTSTTAPTPTETLLPFAGFGDLFRLFRTWYLEDKTYFYFLNAGIEDTLYATADEFKLDCKADPSYPVQMICVYDGTIEGRSMMDFRFYTDRARTVKVFEARYDADLMDDTIYHHQYDCPDRGKNVQCTSEYRLYDGICYYAHTCYDACGLYYSKDNLPEVYNEFQGYTTPCD
ncbi:MAG: hypothetical protein VB026_01635 [Anaerolineaceae bacterium]|nr:hypothetical protein [Anaerolineaceae bacterium]